MTALALAPEATYAEPVIGWRVWRILPFETLQGEESYRLCAAGMRGRPKVWEPRAATAAVCSGFSSTHEAPWPDCDCGIYAFRDQAEAAELLEHFATTPNGKGAVGWAIGRVSLWGRVVECEKGWRGQFAYPYALTVHAAGEVTEQICGLYAIDVTADEPLAPPVEEEPDDDEDTLNKVRDGLAEIREALAALRGTPSPPRVKPPPPPEALVPMPDLGLTDDDVLVAVFAAICCRLAEHSWYEDRAGAACDAPAVGRAVYYVRGLNPGEGQRVNVGDDWWWRPDSVNQAGIRKALKALTAEQLLECGKLAYYREFHWRFTLAGRRRLEALRRAGVVPDSVTYKSYATSKSTSEVKLRTRRLRDTRPVQFVWEIERDRPKWREARQAAATQGRRYYREWIRDWLESEERTELVFTDDEVLAAVKSQTRRGPVLASRIMERLAPGLGTKSRSESARLSQALVRLAKQGLVAHADPEAGVWRWAAVAS
jgi:hypothetical protein